MFTTFHSYRYKGGVPCLALRRTSPWSIGSRGIKNYYCKRHIYTLRASTYHPSWRKECLVVTTVGHFTAVVLRVEDITSSLLSWEGLALAYAGNNLRQWLRMFHLLDSYARQKNKCLQLQQKANNIWCSQAVTHPSTNQTQPGLTALIGREAVLSGWYGRWHKYWVICLL